MGLSLMTSLAAASSGGVASATARQTGPQGRAAELIAEDLAVQSDRLAHAQKLSTQRPDTTRSEARRSQHEARLADMQRALMRLTGGTAQLPGAIDPKGRGRSALIAIAGPAGATAVASSADMVSARTGAGADAVAISARAVVGVSTGDGADAVTISADWVESLYTDSADRSRGGEGEFVNADAVSVAGRHVSSIYTGGGNDAIAVTGGMVTSVLAGAGDDRVSIAAVVVSGIDGGAGDDVITVSAQTGLAGGGIGDPYTAPAADLIGRFAQAQSNIVDVSGGYGNDRIAVSVSEIIAIDGGQGDDQIALAGGTVNLRYAAGDGADRVSLAAGAEVLVQLDSRITSYAVERGEDSLTLRFGGDQSITFTGVGGAAAIGVVTGFAPAKGIALVHQAPGLDLSV
ncbi:MAG: hypothetical protein IE922_04820 [Sphingomonadales bacterium]|nr:hypothetical protein [Sphingomonadales bacterium]